MDRDYFHGFKIDTLWNDDLIQQNVTNPAGEVTTYVLKLQEDGLRHALIQLGWTPPPPKEPECLTPPT